MHRTQLNNNYSTTINHKCMQLLYWKYYKVIIYTHDKQNGCAQPNGLPYKTQFVAEHKFKIIRQWFQSINPHKSNQF